MQTIVLAAAANEREVAYDNGTPVGSVSLPYAPHRWTGGTEEDEDYPNVWIANSMLAVRFTADNSTVQVLKGARFFITGSLADFRVWVFDSDREFFAALHGHAGPNAGSQFSSNVPSWTVTPASVGWVYVNVTDMSNPIFVSGDFYIAIEFTVSEQPGLGVDTTGPKSNRGWFVGNQTINGWVEYSDYARQQGLPDGNLMIRALIAPLYGVVNTTTIPTSAVSASELLVLITVVIVIVVTIGIWQVLKRRSG